MNVGIAGIHLSPISHGNGTAIIVSMPSLAVVFLVRFDAWGYMAEPLACTFQASAGSFQNNCSSPSGSIAFGVQAMRIGA
jgi:hypothetical protein